MTEAALTRSTNPPLRAYAVLALGLTAVSLAAVFIRMAQAESMPSLVVAAGRLGIAALILTPLTLPRYQSQLRGLLGSDLMLIGLSGVFLGLHFIFWITSLEHTTVLVSVVLVTTSPLWSAGLEAIFLRTRLSRLVLIGMLLAISGVVIISLPAEGAPTALGGNPLLGSALALAGALAVSIYLVIGRNVRSRLPLFPYIWLVYGVGAVTALAAVVVTSTPIAGYSSTGYVLLLALALIPQLIGHSAFNYVLEYFSATYVGISTQLEPVMSAIMAFFLFQEAPRAVQILGSAVVMVGVVLATLGQANPPGSTNNPDT
ncbi:MAG: DMT family transporter [Aggregatilineales bacterium]